MEDDSRAALGQDFRIDANERVDGTRAVVLALFGDADMSGAAELENRLTELIEEGPFVVLVDLSGVTLLDSTMLSVLLHGLRRSTAAGGQLRIVAAREEVRRIFELTLLDRVFELDASREVALAATALPSS